MTASRSDNPETPLDRDAVLAGLLDELLKQPRTGGEPDLSRIERDHPDLVEEVRELLATAQLAEEFGSSSLASTHGLRAPAPPEPAAPPQQFGDYDIVREIGRGGMGIVYLARQRSLDRPVALKLLPGGSNAPEQDRQRFRSEAGAAARLDHPHIVPVYEVGEFGGQPFFSMKHITGRTLGELLQDGPLESEPAARLMVQLCSAIAAAHARGILHRDLKPSNILLDQQNQPFITDFGLAKRLDQEGHSLTESGAILGTPGYLSPEQASGGRQPVGPRSDVYSLGAILYAMLTGRAPFHGPTPVQTIMLVLEQEPIPPRVLNPHADPDLQLIVLKCLQKPQDLRYRSVAELQADLEAWLRHESIAARSSRFRDVLNRAFRESPHAPILENWGLLWMLHAAVLLLLCFVTNAMQFADVEARTPYVLLWTAGTGIWAAVFWNLRHRAGPTTFVERQIAHVWAGSMLMSSLLFGVEALLGLPVLALSPVLGLIGGAVFLAKAGILSGQFYVQALALFATGMGMAWWQQSELPPITISLFGIVSALAFFLPGWQYHRSRTRRER